MSNTADTDSGFGERLRQAREVRGINQTELAAKAGLQPSAIGHFEKERRKPSFANIRALAKALSVTSDYLLGRTTDMAGATTAFRGEANLSDGDREHIQMMIDLMNQRSTK
jgi:transcriptional regulator with XRE-family HTH domain